MNTETNTISPEALLGALNWRYATKQFDASRKLSDEELSTLVESLRLAPSSFGLQLWKFIVVEDQALKDKLMKASWNQSQVSDCSQLIVFTAKTNPTAEDVERFIERMAEVRGLSVESLAGYRDFAGGFVERSVKEGWASDWTKRQVYIALGQLMTSAAAIGVDTCPMEGIEPENYDAILGLEGSGYETVVVCPIGFRSSEDKYGSAAKVRFEESDVVEKR